ncbi:MAG: hypothetical protein ACF8MJ_13560 [Phycisphaerales bacterium JB050]
MHDQPSNGMRVELPPEGGAGCLTILAIFIAFFVGVAAYNLIHIASLSTIAIVCSALWICFVLMWVIGGIVSVGGVERAYIQCLGIFARKAFVEIYKPLGGTPKLRHGFELRGRDYEYDCIELSRVETVDWSTGQASGMRGFDCHDWTVAVWFWKSEDADSSHHGLVNPNRGLILITPYLTKLRAISVGRQVGEMLIAAGLPLSERDDDCGYYRDYPHVNAERLDYN